MTNFVILALFTCLCIFIYWLLKYFATRYKILKFVHILKEDAKNDILGDGKRKKLETFSEEYGFLQKKLLYAGFDSKFSQELFLVASVASGLIFGLLLVFVVENILVWLIMFSIGFCLPYYVLLILVDKRRDEFNDNLAEIIDKITSLMKSGIGFDQSLKKAVDGCKSDFSKSIFEIYLRDKDILGEDKAFLKLLPLVESKELRIFYLTISVGRQSGGKFSEMFEKLRTSISDQKELNQELIVATREVRVGIYFLLLLIVFVYFMLNQGLNGILNEHFFDTQSGRTQMFFILLWVCVGMFVNSRLVKIR